MEAARAVLLFTGQDLLGRKIMIKIDSQSPPPRENNSYRPNDRQRENYREPPPRNSPPRNQRGPWDNTGHNHQGPPRNQHQDNWGRSGDNARNGFKIEYHENTGGHKTGIVWL